MVVPLLGDNLLVLCIYIGKLSQIYPEGGGSLQRTLIQCPFCKCPDFLSVHLYFLAKENVPGSFFFYLSSPDISCLFKEPP